MTNIFPSKAMQRDVVAVIISMIIFGMLMLFVMSPVKYKYIRKEISESCTSCNPIANQRIGNLWLVGDLLTIGLSAIVTVSVFQLRRATEKS